MNQTLSLQLVHQKSTHYTHIYFTSTLRFDLLILLHSIPQAYLRFLVINQHQLRNKHSLTPLLSVHQQPKPRIYSKYTAVWLITVKPSLRMSENLPLRPDGFGALVVSMLASGTQVCGFKPGRSRWILSDVKNPQNAFLRRGSKRICPMSQLCGMSKILVIYVNYGLLAKLQVQFLPSLAEVSHAAWCVQRLWR